MNNYEKGQQLISESDFHVKKLETFRGHDGMIGMSADVYSGKTKLCYIHDSARGGCLEVSYYGSCEQMSFHMYLVKSFYSNLPQFTNKDRGYDWDEDKKFNWNEEDFLNEIANQAIAMKEFKKQMKKITFIKGDELVYYSAKSSDLKKTFTFAEGVMTLEENLKIIENKEGIKILNFLPEDEAFDLYRKHS